MVNCIKWMESDSRHNLIFNKYTLFERMNVEEIEVRLNNGTLDEEY